LAIERTLVLIRERPMIDLLDLSLVVLRKRPFALGLAAMVGIAPFWAFNVWLFQTLEDQSPYFALTIWMIEAPFATAPMTLMLGGLMFGQKPGLGRIIGSLFRGSVGLIAVQGFFRYLLFFLIPSRLSFANEILLLERGRWWKILGRGSDLSSGRSGELFLLWLCQLILTYLFAFLFFIGVTLIKDALFVEEMTWQLPDETSYDSWRFQLPIWVSVAFFAVVGFLTYIDQRIRLEGWEIELRLREVGQALEEARRW
jgi:hypothetical protein